MGALTLPPSGSVYLDANTIIYRIEMIEPFFSVSKPLWDALDAGIQPVVTSELSLLEVLVKPLRVGDSALQTLFVGTLYGTPGLSCVAITRQILATAARLRAMSGLKTPDSIHAATALTERCTLLLTNDPVFRRVAGLNVAILAEIAAAP